MSRSLLRFFAALVLATALVAAAFIWQKGLSETASASAAPVSVIIELNGDPGAVYKAKSEKAGHSVSVDELQSYRATLTAKQDQLLNDMRARGISFSVETLNIQGFDGQTAATVPFRFSLVYNGITLTVPQSSIAAIKALPQVKSVHYNGVHRIKLDRSVKYINAPKAYGQVEELTPFDDLREGFEGQGINIAVLDTGIDWTHEMFGGDATPPRLGVAPPNGNFNKKVIYYLPTTAGLLDGFGHGSHSSGDAAGYLGFAPGADGLPGTADDERVHGVAPQARLMGYKVCVDAGSCVNASTILAIEDAVSPRTLNNLQKPVAHVINMSLGGAGTPDDPEAIASDNATLMGTIVVASAGNEGPGEGTVGAPSVGRRVISVGANTDPGSGVNTADVLDGSRTGMKAVLLDGATPVAADITNNYVYCGLAETPDQVPDSVSGHVALIARGGSVNTPDGLPTSAGTGLFSNKAAFAYAKGAVAVIIYNNAADPDEELTAATVRKALIPVLGMSRRNGEFLKSIIGSETQGALSAKQVRINAAKVFSADMADFSSRGPVAGYGQIKPDITAPGVDILSATVRVGSADANTATMFDPTGYISASGTSFSGPHVSGASALIKQAHLNWTPDMVRTALINTATNLRSASGTPKADGSSDSIIAQGGGLIDVWHAINAKALMGVAGDGIAEPSILGSHSYGEVPVINSRITHTENVTVTIKDVSGQQRTYNLSVANNRNAQSAGISTALSQTSITVPANGEATFTVGGTVDGDLIRQLSNPPVAMQWYVTASSADGESLRMPFYMVPVLSVPANQIGSVATYTGQVTVGDGGLQLLDGVSYVDVPFEVDDDTFSIDARLDFPQVVAGLFHDLDFALLDPDGNVVKDSANSGGPEFINVRVTRGGTYKYRVIGFANAQTDFTITSKQLVGGASDPATLSTISGEFVNAQAQQVDFDGQFKVSWQKVGGEQGFEVERSSDGGQNWEVVTRVAPDATSATLTDQPDGTYSFRVRSLYPGQIGTYVSDPSNAQTIVVSRRTLVDITNVAESAIVDGTLSFAGGATQFDMKLVNKDVKTYLPRLSFRVVGISSTSGQVAAANADSGGDGRAVANAAVYDYSQRLGTDEAFSASEVSGAKTFRFSNPRGELFSIVAQVTAYERAGGTGGGEGGPVGAPPPSQGGLPVALPNPTSLLQLTFNPVTRTVTVRRVSANLLR
jgi:subtilisin family serine protease